MIDPPCRLIVVVGMPSGGTSCVAGTLTHNGFYNRDTGPRGSYQSPLPLSYCQGLWGLPSKALDEDDMVVVGQWALDHKLEALERGFDKAVQKMPGPPIWMPEMFGPNPLGIKIEPLLVFREPRENAESIKNAPHFHYVRDAEKHAARGQIEILKLHEKYNWPIWKFGKDSDIIELERLLNVPLPNKIFNPDRIKTG